LSHKRSIKGGEYLGVIQNRDLDNDGTPDSEDNCVNLSNMDQADSNDNGIGDACDYSTDSDSNGLSDAQNMHWGQVP